MGVVRVIREYRSTTPPVQCYRHYRRHKAARNKLFGNEGNALAFPREKKQTKTYFRTQSTMTLVTRTGGGYPVSCT